MKPLFKIFITLGLFFVVSGCDTSITKYHDPNTLSHEEILEDLKSGNFQRVLLARTQLARLKPKERMAVLKELLKEKKPELRLTAVTELEKIKPTSCKILLEVSKSDPDPDVRSQAIEAARGCISPAQDQSPSRPQPSSTPQNPQP